ncbi:uncharacterized protein DUF2490 [Chitinophaga dinghuensis]|uniref:Uncharacterized protein DUF2490 n=1 Tax=Chitinophaga dinghuensis TaxID=1539050 RepID=A0A327VPX8_9BACT|nr:DUF2490 domain-containing protein [Chitinophaga dinghuensis]RAJ75608.1 uncharacterized protein DUF2490 [Chitinophaga dinghuensis]
MIRKFSWLLLLAFVCQQAAAQDVTQLYQNWYTYFGTAKINNKWAIPFDVQLRLRDGFSNKGQLLMRGGLQYSLNKQNHVLLGYAYVPTYSNAADTWLPEHRIFQQYIHKSKKVDMTHRFRLEQRWVGQPNPDGPHKPVNDWKYGNRTRYFNRTQLPIKYKKEPTSFYVALQDEIFLNLWGNQISNLLFDQNRFLVAGGYQIKSNLKVDIGYMNQLVQVTSGAKTMNHILHFGVFHNFDL